MEKIVEVGKQLGLAGADLAKFINEQQAFEREERRLAREAEVKRIQAEAEAETRRIEAEAQDRAHQLELKRLELQMAEIGGAQREASAGKAKAPKLPAFVDGKDELDSYLLRFERFAVTCKWERSEWASALSALLTGRALDVYSRLSDDDAVDYDQLKQALLNRYDLNEEGYRCKFRNSKPEKGESPSQFAVRLQNYLQKWVKLSGFSIEWKDVSSLLVKEQFLKSCPKELSTHLMEQAPKTLDSLTGIAEQFLAAHNREMAHDVRQEVRELCADCKQAGHATENCPKRKPDARVPRKCFLCDKVGHIAKDCYSRALPPVRMSSAAACSMEGVQESNLPLREGVVNNQTVTVLRDTGCTGVLVDRKFVHDDQVSDRPGFLSLADGSVVSAEVANMEVNTPYFTGEVEALCLNNPSHDLVIGNIGGVRPADDPDPLWRKANAALTRFQKKTSKIKAKYRVVPPNEGWPLKNQAEFKKVQDATVEAVT
uniref:Uncharacterized protein LOC108950802 n=1 Tax=Phallusia mammillata TaxID=59560 RepID=A0A6F9DIN8_9ASCI|nr:uncharacterized protein LOC108950802 [Phallusia mammillata]